MARNMVRNLMGLDRTDLLVAGGASSACCVCGMIMPPTTV